jgi:transposase
MKAKERIAQLEAEVANLKEHLARALARIHELEGREAKNSHNSSKPPSSDGSGYKRLSQRKPSEKPSGGQPGHRGHHLGLVESPDEIIRHRPSHCQHCQQPLAGIEGDVAERRQVQELPAIRLMVQEHQVEVVRCPQCQQVSRGTFPPEVSAPTQYGANVKALAVYLHQYQLVPLERSVEVLEDLGACGLSQGTLVNWEQEAAQRLEATVEHIAERVTTSRVQHADETGMRVRGKGHWVHVNSTRDLAHLAWHQKRGRAALEAIGIWPRFAGRAMHDRWRSYDGYACAHSMCAAHLVRDLTFLAEEAQQAWAADLKDVLLAMYTAVQEWRMRGAHRVPLQERDEWVAQYFAILARGYAAQPLVSAQAQSPPKKGRPKQSPAKNLLDDLLSRAEQVLAFLDDLTLPFTNNQAERDLRMVKVQQKIAGTFRTESGATIFCRIRSYLATMRKQGHAMLAALAAVFAARPFPIAWSPE